MQTSELLHNYLVDSNTWDEMYTDKSVRRQYQSVVDFMQQMSIEELNKKEELAKRLFMSQGITFTVYSSGEGIEKIFPFDIIPRIITAAEWSYIEEGIRQRLKALNLFLKDVYNDQFILKDGIVPVDMVYSCPHFLREMHGFHVPHDIYVHIAGIDLIRDHDGTFYILEDNLRTPSGVSYMLENREIIKRIFPDMLPRNNVRTVMEYPTILHKNLVSLSPRQTAHPTTLHDVFSFPCFTPQIFRFRVIPQSEALRRTKLSIARSTFFPEHSIQPAHLRASRWPKGTGHLTT